MQVTDYDCMGNIREYHKKDGTPVTIIWSYSHQYPVMEIVGKTYAQIYSVASSVSQLENMLSPSYSTVKSVYNSIRQGLPDALVTAYLYAPWHNVSRIIQPNGYEVSYGYDSYGRLTDATDASGVLQRYIYNYKNR
jgi:YD repeat-containing protein